MTEPEAAVAILQTAGPAESILLMRRAERLGDSWSGHWSFPGGRREADDPDLLHTALRELDEECGIRLAPAQLRTALPYVLARRKVGRYLLVAPFVFGLEAELPTILHAPEAVSSRWVPLALLRDPLRHALGPVPGRPREMLFPAVDLDGHPLWGFTYRLIMDWLRLDPLPSPVEQAGFQAACLALDFLLANGLSLRRDWRERRMTNEPPGQRIAKVAEVIGVVPVAAVIEHFSVPGRYCAAVNCLEVRPELVRIIGPAFEEYLIRAIEN